MLKQLVFGSILVLLSVAQAANIGISPPRLELAGAPGETITETIIILGDNAEEQQVRVRVGDWTLKPNGDLVILPANSLAESSSEWVQPELDEFVLIGDEDREFRVTVTIPENAGLAGTYHSLLFFSIVPPPRENGGVGVITTTEVAMAIYVTVTQTEDNASELLDFYQSDDRDLSLLIVNDGNTLMRLGGAVELRNEEGNTVHFLEIPDLPVLRESERDLVLPIPKDVEAGFYIALALLEDSRGGLLVGELPLDVP